MNREIKFRAWDTVLKEMLEVTHWTIPYSMSTKSGKRRLDNAVLMQFTGLLDKNGKEIYEGDVVQWREANGRLKTEKVVWEEELIAYVTRDEVDFVNTYLGGTQRNHLEVIGNIWENPDLLV